jgi:signal transduction histidine kinase
VPVGNEPEALLIGLTELAERINAIGQMTCRLEAPGSVTVSDAAVAGHLYRIAQEAVNNALKHARARTAVVRLLQREDGLLLEISDDGVGLPLKPNAKRRGLGLGVMQHRANVIGAELTITSKRGGGVTVRCVLPQS